MPKFVYEAKTDTKETVKATLTADNKSAAIQRMARMNYYIISIEEEKLSNDAKDVKSYFLNRITLKNVTDFTRQLSNLLESGLTLVKALDILREQTDNPRLRGIIADISDFCMAGNSLSSALARHPRIFSGLYVSMVHAGETGGALEKILKRLADFHEKQLEIQTKVKTALAYPVLMSMIGAGTIIILLSYVMPKMMAMFKDFGQALPLPTQILLSLSYVLSHFGWLVMVVLVALAITLIKIHATVEGRLAMDRLQLKVPLLGKLVKKVEIAGFTRTLATLLHNGVPMLESLKVVSGTMNNMVMRQEITRAFAAVREGASLAQGLQHSKVIPLAVVNMITIGEEGGHLESSLFKIAEAGERESDEAIKVVMSLLEPMLILVLGAIVGFIVMAMLLPIFEINFLMQ